ncbi:MAG: transposase, partial [Myxococcota bacterium]
LLIVDGGFRPGEPPTFHAAPPLTKQDLEELCARMERALVGILGRYKLIRTDDDTGGVATDALGACLLGAMSAGQREKRGPALALADEDDVETPRGKQVASVDGLNLYASGVMADRADLERTARYLLRPPFALGRFAQRPDGLITYRMKKPDRRGNTVLVLDAMALMARLAALIPAPRRQTHRLFGVLGPASMLRRHIVPVPTHRQGRAEGHSHDEQPPAYKQRIPWAELLRRTFDVDALECPRCGGRLRVVTVVKDPAEARRYASHMGLCETDRHARGPPELAA